MNAIANMFQAFRITSSKDPKAAVKSTTTSLKSPKDSQEKESNGKVELREICLKEVGMHDDFSDCWIVIYDRVFDVTKFLSAHPGGEDIIMDYAGRDATLGFRGTGHSRDAIDMMNDYLIGELPEHERIFRTHHVQILRSDIPE